MKRFILGLALASVAVTAGAAFAGDLPEVVIGAGTGAPVRTPYCQAFNRTLDSDTCYVMTGLYYVEPGFTLTIQPGTVIEGHKATGGTLIITKGADINAQGTLSRPIIFTSSEPAGVRAPGDWGGIIILGDAPVNKVNPVIEGGLIGGSCTPGGTVTYGGANAADNSGILRYVRIEYCGFRFQLNNEVNGLTLGGVGSGTQIDHIQVSYSNDDAYEWFGGTVNCKYLVAFGTVDDEFDTDFGYTGKVQFGFALRDPDNSDPTGQSNGFESDNDGSATSTATPYTRPIFSNMTVVGPERINAEVPFPLGETFEYSMLLRRSTKTNIYNSVIMGYPWGVALRDATTQGFATANDLKVRRTSVQATLNPSGSTNIHQDTASGWTNVDVWFATAGWNNLQNTARQPDTILLNNLTNLNNPDPRPTTGSELIASADFTDPDLAGLTVTSYRGAFPPTSVASKNQLWTAYWTEWDPQNQDYCDSVVVYTGVGDKPSYAGPHLSQNYPNPFNPMTSIDYTVSTDGNVTLDVFDATGARVRTLVSEAKKAGTYTASFNADGLASGVYFYRLKAVGVDEMKKMVLLK